MTLQAPLPFSCLQATIEREHQSLMMVVCDLQSAALKNANDFARILSHLEHITAQHFFNEEKLWRSTSSDPFNIEDHLRGHRDLLRLLSDANRFAGQQNKPNRLAMAKLIERWLQDELTADHRFTRTLRYSEQTVRRSA